MFTVHITPKNSASRKEIGRFAQEDEARAFAERKLIGYRQAIAEVFNEHDGGYICSTIFLGR